jgi:hypothetical protein
MPTLVWQSLTRRYFAHAKILPKHNGVIKEFASGEEIVDEIAIFLKSLFFDSDFGREEIWQSYFLSNSVDKMEARNTV